MCTCYGTGATWSWLAKQVHVWHTWDAVLVYLFLGDLCFYASNSWFSPGLTSNSTEHKATKGSSAWLIMRDSKPGVFLSLLGKFLDKASLKIKVKDLVQAGLSQGSMGLQLFCIYQQIINYQHLHIVHKTSISRTADMVYRPGCHGAQNCISPHSTPNIYRLDWYSPAKMEA